MLVDTRTAVQREANEHLLDITGSLRTSFSPLRAASWVACGEPVPASPQNALA
jgi:hypothetical protein